MPRLLRGRVRPLSVSFAAALGGCYQYVPVRATTPPEQAEARVELTDDGSTALTGLLGPGVELVDGRIQRADRDSVILLVSQTTVRGGREDSWRGERIAVPRSAVASLSVRRLSATRSAIAVVAGAAVLVAGAIGFRAGSPATRTGGNRLPPPQ